MKYKLLLILVLAVPLLAFAHGDVIDTHVDGQGAPAVSNTPETDNEEVEISVNIVWWILLLGSLVLMAALSYGVWRFLQVRMPESKPQK